MGNRDFVYTERIRCRDEDLESFDAVADFYGELRATIGQPLGGVVKSSSGFVTSAPQIMAEKALPVPLGSPAWFIGPVSPSALGLPDAADVGSFDGRNMIWLEALPELGNFFMQPSFAHRILEPGVSFDTPMKGSRFTSMAISPDGQMAATLQHLESHSYLLMVVELPTMAPVSSTLVSCVSASLAFSPDNQWLLLDGPVIPPPLDAGSERSRTTQLIHLPSMGQLSVPVADVGSLSWNPSAGSLNILGVKLSSGAGTSELFGWDLEAGELTAGPQIVVNPDTALNHVMSLRPDPGGATALARTYVGKAQSMEGGRGGSLIASLVDLVSLEVNPLTELEVTGDRRDSNYRIERCHDSLEWRVCFESVAEVSFHSSVQAQMFPLPEVPREAVVPDRSHGYLTTLNACGMAQTGEFGERRPSLFASLFKRALADLAFDYPDEYLRIRDGIRGFTQPYFLHALMNPATDIDSVADREMYTFADLLHADQLSEALLVPCASVFQ